MEEELRQVGYVAKRGSDFDPWDLEVSCGLLGAARLSVAAEPHGNGLQLLRISCRPRCSLIGLALAIIFGALGRAAELDGAWNIYLLLDGIALWVLGRTLHECGTASAAFLSVVRKIERLDRKALPWERKSEPATALLGNAQPQTL